MTVFVLLATLLAGVVAIRLLWAALRARPATANTTMETATVAVLREQLQTLDSDLAAGQIDALTAERARLELQRRLLEEAAPATPTGAAAAPPSSTAGRAAAVVVVLCVPVLAALAYSRLGSLPALDPSNTQSAAQAEQHKMQTMVDQLAQRLQQHPDDLQGWAMLAGAYKLQGRLQDAAKAYERAQAFVDTRAELLASQAEVLARLNHDSLQGRPSALLDQALALDPRAPNALLLAGAAANERGDHRRAIDLWERLAAQFDPASEEGNAIAQAVAQARQAAAAAGQAVPAPKANAAASVAFVSGVVRLAPDLANKLQPGDTLFVFARPDDGTRMPLAALRATARELPLTFKLDDSMALAPGRSLSGQKTVRLEARIAKAGMAQTAPGDLYGVVEHVAVGSTGVELLINQVQP